MPPTRITVMNNGSLRVEGDFEIVDQEGRVFGLAGRTQGHAVPLRPVEHQAVLRQHAQDLRIRVGHRRPRPAAARAQAGAVTHAPRPPRR